jgi:hypothetical protein
MTHEERRSGEATRATTGGGRDQLFTTTRKQAYVCSSLGASSEGSWLDEQLLRTIGLKLVHSN